MKLSIIPKNDIYFDLFKKASENLTEAAELLADSLKNPEKAVANAKLINDLEHKGDEIVTEISQKLQKTFVTPFDSEDIHELRSTIDSILDSIDSISEKISLYNVQEIPEPAVGLAEEITNSSRMLTELTGCLKKMYCDIDIIEGIKNSERTADKIYRKAIAGLFSNGLDVLEVIKWKDIYEDLEDANDFCREAAIMIEGIILKHA